MIYLASPYSHPDAAVRQQRYEAVATFVAERFGGRVIFSPIVYSHNMAVAYDLPLDAAAWQRFNNAMQYAAKETWVLMLPGWEQSRGVQYEIEFAKQFDHEITYVEA
jgi:hypothetical protein